MDMKKIALASCFTILTGGTTLYAMTGPGLETRTYSWLVTSEKTRAEVVTANEEYYRERRERERTTGSIRSYSGGNSRYSGRVK